jgi:hypothetical protein
MSSVKNKFYEPILISIPCNQWFKFQIEIIIYSPMEVFSVDSFVKG